MEPIDWNDLTVTQRPTRAAHSRVGYRNGTSEHDKEVGRDHRGQCEHSNPAKSSVGPKRIVILRGSLLSRFFHWEQIEELAANEYLRHWRGWVPSGPRSAERARTRSLPVTRARIVTIRLPSQVGKVRRRTQKASGSGCFQPGTCV